MLTALLVFQTNSAASGSNSSLAPKRTVITVTAGKPSEFEFELSEKMVPAGTVVFEVKNEGQISHSFKICASPTGGTSNSCVGTVTPLLGPGKSTTLTATLKKGIYEYLCPVPGHAAAGMKGELGVGVTPPIVSIPKATIISVDAGKPSEFRFELSEEIAPAGTVVFEVKNEGQISHSFKICASPTGGTSNSCVGTVTPLLAPGKSGLIIVGLKKGTYEYLCTVPGHAAAGMKGTLGIGVSLSGKPAPTTPTPTTATTTTATTTTPTRTSTSPTPTSPTSTTTTSPTSPGDPVDGAAVWASAGCGSCHTMSAAGSTGTIGPNLDFAMPSQALVIAMVTSGGGQMPSFSAQLTAQQIADVAAYVYQSTQ